MRKLITFVIIVFFVSKLDLSNLSTLNLSSIFKDINLANTPKTIYNYIKDPKDLLTDLIDKDFEKLHAELNTLEVEYYDKLLLDYKIDKAELEKLLNKTESKNKESVKKQYIMDKTKLTEMEYYQIFIFPFNKVEKPKVKDNMSFTDFKDSYENYLIESINYLENKLND